MPFPDTRERVIYRKNPLDKVICQLRFPPILKIDTEVPAQFQERTIKDFPNFSEKEQIALPIPKRVQGDVPAEIFQQMIPREIKIYQFSSEDNIWTVNLTRTFMALTTKDYQRQKDFETHLQIPLQPLLDIYQPTGFTRVGLRFIDIIKRSVFNLQDVPWSALLRPCILGLISANEVNQNIRSFDTNCEILLDDGTSMVRIICGLLVDVQNEERFMIDSDFYTTQKMNISDSLNKLDYFHVRAARLFKWLITDTLHEAMDPETI